MLLPAIRGSARSSGLVIRDSETLPRARARWSGTVGEARVRAASCIEQQIRHTELKQETELVAEFPALLALTVVKAGDQHARKPDSFARGRRAIQRFRVSAFEVAAR